MVISQESLELFAPAARRSSHFTRKAVKEKGIDMGSQIKNSNFLLKVAFCSDFCSEVNSLNLMLQGRLQWLHTTFDKVAAFKGKMQLYERMKQKGDTSMFLNLTISLQCDLTRNCLPLECSGPCNRTVLPRYCRTTQGLVDQQAIFDRRKLYW